MPGTAVDVIRRVNAAFNAGDYDAMLAMYDPQAEFVDHMPLPDVARAAYGQDEMRAVLDSWTEGFRGFQADVTEYVDLGDFAVAVTQWHFVSRDEGVELSWKGAEAWQVRDGKVVWGQAGFADRRSAVEAAQRRAGDLE